MTTLLASYAFEAERGILRLSPELASMGLN
jgi:hypothetical protein